MKGEELQIEPSFALVKAIKRILFSLVHFLLKVGITFPQLSEMLKEVYIDVADAHFRLDEKQQTQTRLSFLTGIHRKDVKRLHNVKQDKDEPDNISVGVKLVSMWLTNSRYLDASNKPLILPLKSKESVCFEDLIETICKKDIRPRVILDEWLNLGIVKLIDDKKVMLCTEAFVPRKGQDEKSFFLGQNISDHLYAASNNLLTDTPRFFERCVYYDGLTKGSVDELRELSREYGMEMLVKLNERASQLKQNSVDKLDSNHRVNVGIYLYHENNSSEL